jgi:hypothetical protein
MSANPQSMMNLLQAFQAIPQPGANPLLSQDPTAEARGNYSSGAHTDVSGRTGAPPPMTGRSQSEGRGAELSRMAREASGGGGGTGTYTPQPGIDSPNGPVGLGGHLSDAAGVIKGNQPSVPWNVEVDRGTGANTERENWNFQKGEAPQTTELGTPAQELAQKNDVALAQAQHPAKPTKNYDRAGDIDLLKTVGSEINEAAKIPDGLRSDADQQHLADLRTMHTTLLSRLTSGEGYGDTNTTTTGPAGQTPQGPTGQAPAQMNQPVLKPPSPGTKLDAALHPDIVNQYLQQANGDRNKARQLATQDGWTL